MKRVYLASRYSRADEMQGVRDVLADLLGVEVTSRWIDKHPDTNGPTLEQSFKPEALAADPEGCGRYATVDLDDVLAADTVISFTCGTGGKGGRHVEFGIGVGAGKRLIVVGPREHIFHTLPGVEWYPDWPHLVMALVRSKNAPPPPAVPQAPERSEPEVTHACPPEGSGLTPCCERTPCELPMTDRMTLEPGLVTCRPVAAGSEGSEQ